MTSEAIAPIASVTVESTMNLTYQTVMRSCYKPGKILSAARWERKSPGPIRKAKTQVTLYKLKKFTSSFDFVAFFFYSLKVAP